MEREPESDVDQISRAMSESGAGTFFGNARTRSRRRRSPWNLLLPLVALPIWCLLTGSFTWLAATLHAALHEDQGSLFAAGPMTLPAALVLFPSLVAAMSPSFVIANRLACSIPPARRAMEAESRRAPGTRYRESQRALTKAASWTFVVCAPVVLAGAILS